MPGAVPCEAGTPQGQKRHHDQHQRLRLQLQLCLWVEDQRNGLAQTGRWRRWCISPWPHVEARTCDTQRERPSAPRQPIHVHASTAPSAAHWLVLVHGDTNTRRRFTCSCWVTPMGVMIVDTAVQKLPRAMMPRWILPAHQSLSPWQSSSVSRLFVCSCLRSLWRVLVLARQSGQNLSWKLLGRPLSRLSKPRSRRHVSA